VYIAVFFASITSILVLVLLVLL